MSSKITKLVIGKVSLEGEFELGESLALLASYGLIQLPAAAAATTTAAATTYPVVCYICGKAASVSFKPKDPERVRCQSCYDKGKR
jgi:CxxC-x17-CxxC domain-containing protein